MFEVFKMPHVWTHAEYADMVFAMEVPLLLSKNIVDSFQTAEFRIEECFLQTFGPKSVF